MATGGLHGRSILFQQKAVEYVCTGAIYRVITPYPPKSLMLKTFLSLKGPVTGA